MDGSVVPRCLAVAETFPEISLCCFLSIDLALRFIIQRTVFLGFGDDGALALSSSAMCLASSSSIAQSTCRNCHHIVNNLTLIPMSRTGNSQSSLRCGKNKCSLSKNNPKYLLAMMSDSLWAGQTTMAHFLPCR